MGLVAWKLHVPEADGGSRSSDSLRSSLKRVDFVGAAFLSVTVLSFLLVLDMGGEKAPWASPIIVSLVGICVAFGVLFYMAEKSWAKEPIFPLQLLSQYDVVTSYLIMAFQNASQTAVGIQLFPLLVLAIGIADPN